MLLRRLSSQAGQALIIAVLLLVLLASCRRHSTALFLTPWLSRWRSDIKRRADVSGWDPLPHHNSGLAGPLELAARRALPAPTTTTSETSRHRARAGGSHSSRFPSVRDDPIASVGGRTNGHCLCSTVCAQLLARRWCLPGTYSPDARTQDPLDLDATRRLSSGVPSVARVPNLPRQVAYIRWFSPSAHPIADTRGNWSHSFGIPTWVDVMAGFADRIAERPLR